MGIGEVAEITGVSARQLRYWESKGIIRSACEGNLTNRKYDYENIEKIVLIKDFLDQGFTLEASARRLDERIRQINQAVSRLTDRYGLEGSKGLDGADFASNGLGREAVIEGQTCVLVGMATHTTSGERLQVYMGPDRNPASLLAVPTEK